MILLVFIWFTILYFVGYKSDVSKDVFSPSKFISMKFALLNLGFILFTYFYPQSFLPQILTVTGVDLDDAFFNYAIVQTVAYISLLMGIKVVPFFREKQISKVQNTNNKYLYLGILLFIIGFYSFLSFIIETGGIIYLLNNLSRRVELLSGQNLNYFMPLLTLGVLIMLYDYSIKKSKGKFILIIFFSFLAILCYSSLGGRKNSLYFIISMIVGYNYFVKPINIRNIKKSTSIIILSGLIFYILIIPIARKPNGVEDLISGKVDLIEILEIENLVYSVSYVYIDVFAANYFNVDNAWYLSSPGDIYLNLIKGDKKSSELPPIDDGVYFKSIVVYGADFKPPVARSELFYSSWPIENFGFAYANLLLPGVIIFFFLQGVVFKKCYNFLVKTNYLPVSVFIYVFIIFNFNFSNLRIVQLILLLIIVIPSFFIFKKIENKPI